MYKRSYQSWRKHFDFLLLDILCLHIAYVCAFWMMEGWSNPYGASLYRICVLIATLVEVLVAIFSESYKHVLRRGYYREFVAILKQFALCTLIFVLLLFFVRNEDQVDRLFLLVWLGIASVFTYCERCFWKKFINKKANSSGKRAMLIVTIGSQMASVLENIRKNNYERYRIVGISVIDQDLEGQHMDGVKIVANSDDICEFVCKNWVDEVFIDLGEDHPIPDFLIEEFESMGVVTHISLLNSKSVPGRKQFVERVAGYTVLTTSINYATPAKLFIKRFTDICVGLFGCILTGLLFLIVAPMVYSKSPGPIFFSQERVGENGKVFKIYKFRSMYLDAEERKKELESQNTIDGGLMFKMEDDPRIIGYKKMPDGSFKKGIGHFLRGTSLDEFPQFLNVLKGDMSLVGTRPPTVDEWQRYELHHRARLSTKPGITGMWQVSGRSTITDFEEIVNLDREYIRNWSLGNDIKILLKTVKVVLKGEGSM
ncbi:MAG: sugar transferase [Ruminococcus sp.]